MSLSELKNKKLRNVAILTGLCFVGVWISYFFLGHHLISAAYEGKSLRLINQIIAGQAKHPLTYYTQKADTLIKNFLIWGISTMGMIVVLLWVKEKIKAGTKKIALNLFVFGLAFMFSFLMAESLCRVMGFKPLAVTKNKIKVEPGGKLVAIHPTLGYIFLPGQFQVTLPSDYSFTITHTADAHRATHPFAANGIQNEKKEIWIFGCSFTYGWSLNDNETYPWLLQEELPNYEVVNFGTIGYGTLQPLIQFREALQKGKKPAAIVYAYASFHDERNTFLRKRRQAVGSANELGSFRQPYARFDKNGNLIYSMADVIYHEFPFARYSALIHLLEEKYNDLEEPFIHSHEVTKAIIKDFHTMAEQQGIEFVVAGIDSDSARTLNELHGEGIKTVDIAVDLSDQKNRNWPYDSHPNAKANRVYAQKLEAFLNEQVLKKPEMTNQHG